MSKLNDILRKRINKRNRKNLINKDFSLIASNCNGGFLLHDLNLQFKTPFINLWMKPNDFIKYLQNITYYQSCSLVFKEKSVQDYPVGILDDIEIYFQHYKTKEEAKAKWEERSKRINLDNLFILFTDRDGCTYQNLLDFDKLPYQNKIVFTNQIYSEIKSSFYIKGFEDEESVGLCFEYLNKFTGKKIYDCFDYISWFNKK